jgi:hypothetical protein
MIHTILTRTPIVGWEKCNFMGVFAYSVQGLEFLAQFQINAGLFHLEQQLLIQTKEKEII